MRKKYKNERSVTPRWCREGKRGETVDKSGKGKRGHMGQDINDAGQSDHGTSQAKRKPDSSTK